MGMNNYQIQAAQAKKYFLTYEQSCLIDKFHLKYDAQYIYVNFLCKLYRIQRTTGHIEKKAGGSWADADSFPEIMTLLDLICDSKAERCLTHRWKNMQAFGLQFHQSLLENQNDPAAELFDQYPEEFRKACCALGGLPIPGGDLAFSIELLDGLSVGIQFWHGDDEFCPRLRYLWDENALQYLHYETMFYAVSLVLARIKEEMCEQSGNMGRKENEVGF